MKEITCPGCGCTLTVTTETSATCRGCGQALIPVTLYLHEGMAKELDWLVNLRKQMSDEADVSAVLSRLIVLEVDKRKRIEANKARK